MRHAILLACGLAACSSSFDADDADGADGADGSGDGGSGDGGSASGLTDVTAGLDTEGCEDVDGKAVPGAVSYFTGEYLDQGSQWVGSERWLLFANAAWRDLGDGDCVVTWYAEAEQVEPTACGTCDVALEVSATIDEPSTTCPEDLWDSETDRSWSATYEIRIADGQSTWYYASGTTLGTGYGNDSAANFLTEKTCAWF